MGHPHPESFQGPRAVSPVPIHVHPTPASAVLFSLGTNILVA